MESQLRGYQKSGVDRLCEILANRKAAYLADEMGLGKSAQAIRVLEAFQAGKVLIICPASIRLNWAREIKKHELRNWHINIVQKSSDLKRITWKHHPTVTICSYDLADKMPAHLEGGVDFLVADEIHFCKTSTTKRTKAVLGRLWDMASYKLVMSGTPLPNGVIDGFTIFNKFDPMRFRDRYSYGFRYTNAKRNWFTGGWEFKGGRRLGELKQKVQSFMVRRRKAEVLTELPPKVYSQIPLEVKGVKDYQLSEEHKEAVREGEFASLSTACATARRGLGLIKVPEVAKYISEIAVEKDRLVVFAYHRQVIDTLAEMLELKGHKVKVLTGDTPLGLRDRIVQEFQEPGGRIILVAQVQAAGIGINLTAADTCVFAELDWVPATMAQAIDRLHRYGQEANSVAVHYLLAANSMDEQIIGALHQKILVISEALDGRQQYTY